jgi:GT2 family glycosyltransferase/glycosyltransferase involved in cell wall biosynthesis
LRQIDVIIPVYEGFSEVRNCIQSVLLSSNHCAYRIVAIDDGSPSDLIKTYLRQLAEAGRVELLVNEQNQGFVKTVNRGMRLHSDNDVLLLNSDTVVANNWLDRLQAAAYSDQSVGTVTPFSNNAEICSFPRLCRDNALLSDTNVAQVDAILSESLSGRTVEIPTAVGFCMYIKRSCLEDVGYFDAELFQQGYGEENDFCLRARSQGWRNVLAADCFVYHAGGVSFSSRKQKLVERAMRILDEKYPGYHAEVAAHIRADPAYALRCKGLIDILKVDSRKKVLALTHQMGGGTEKHVRELSDCVDAKLAVVVLKPFKGTVFRLTLGTDDDMPGLCFDWSTEYGRASLLRLLSVLGIARLHIHHTMGFEWMLDELLDSLVLPYDITLHDYFLIDGNPTLTDPLGMYQAERERRGRGSNSPVFLQTDAAVEEWRQDMQRLLDGAKRVFVPSRAALDIYRSYYHLPQALVSWHADMLGVESLPVRAPARTRGAETLRVLVIGALGLEKGADLLEQVAMLASGSDIEFILLGYAYRPLDRAVRTLGAYRDAQIDALITAQEADLIWFPCRWPETYSYTLSAALRSGLPLLVPDIGSFPERVEGRPLTWVQAWDSTPEQYLEKFVSVRGQLAALTDVREHDWSIPVPTIFSYDNDYAVGASAPPAETQFSLENVQQHLAAVDDPGETGSRRRLLVLLLRLKSLPALAWLVRLIPYKLQRAIKRRLSRKPLHDILQ